MQDMKEIFFANISGKAAKTAFLIGIDLANSHEGRLHLGDASEKRCTPVEDHGGASETAYIGSYFVSDGQLPAMLLKELLHGI